MGLFGGATTTAIKNDFVMVSTGDINKEYDILGIIISGGSGGYRVEDWQDEIEKLKNAAQSLGGNGVIYARPISDGKYHRFVGTAVKIK